MKPKLPLWARGRKLALDLALAGVGLLVAVILAEGTLRVLGHHPKMLIPPYLYQTHPRTWWTLRPDFEQTLETRDGTVTYRINSQGIRSPREISTSPDDLHVFVLGDSYTFGWQIDESSTFASLLERRLRSTHDRVEVANLGVPGFGTLHSYERLVEYSARLAPPDVVIYVFCPNDPVDNISGKKTVVDGIRIDDHWNHKSLMAKIGHLYFRSRLVGIVAESWYSSSFNPRFQKKKELDQAEVRNENREDYRSIRSELLKMIEWTSERGIPFLVATTSRSEYSETLSKIVDERGVALLELEDVFREAGLTPSDVRLEFDGHWNALGHEWVARALAATLAARGWPPPRSSRDADDRAALRDRPGDG